MSTERHETRPSNQTATNLQSMATLPLHKPPSSTLTTSTQRVENTHFIASISSKIDSTIYKYHQHAKSCRQCQHPKDVYEARIPRHRRCPDGIAFTIQLSNQLYLRATHEPKGTFRVEFKEGWGEIGDLVEVICHSQQGEYTTEVVDLRRAIPKYKSPEETLLSDYDSDTMKRRDMTPNISPSPVCNHPSRSSGIPAVYPDPMKAYPSPDLTPRGSYESQKSVKFK